ncbi:MAG: class I SAM-dependent methyltransferase [Acetobacteraceae bacterium]
MALDVAMAAEFYQSRRGVVTARLLRERLMLLWPDLSGASVLGLGYTGPYLRRWRDAAYRCVALTPAHLGAARWPIGLASLSCSAEEDALPFPDLSFDHVLLVHGLEVAENARGLLREIWRILTDDGRLLVVAPNRSSPWAYAEATPFGQGQPYSTRQLGGVLARSLFRVERRDSALFVPPLDVRIVLRSAALLERSGRRIAPHLGGVTIGEAVKDCYAAVPRRVRRRRLVLSEAV